MNFNNNNDATEELRMQFSFMNFTLNHGGEPLHTELFEYIYRR